MEGSGCLHYTPKQASCLQADELASKNFKVIVPDLRGFGASSRPEGVGAYRLDVIAQDVLNLLTHLQVDK